MDRLTAVRGLRSLWRPARLPRCRASLDHQRGRRCQSSLSSHKSTPPKPYYVTTPIFYVNADPHVGHLFSMVLADVFKRWQTLSIGNDSSRRALLCTGTDEHGLKVQQAAARVGVEPKQFCDENAAVFAELARRAQLDLDFFVRTSDADHVAAVKAFWRRLRRRGYVYAAQHAGWYCVSDETFYPESLVEKRVEPATGRVEMVSVETGKTVEWTEETNYHFRMTAVRQQLLDLYAAQPSFVVPASRMAEVVDWVTNHLEDLSISRPASRLQWGIPVPDDPSQTIYVWVDALVNYLTKAGYPGLWGEEESQEERRGESSENNRKEDREDETETSVSSSGGWPADVHVLGKDIVRFHAVYWPALLLAVGIAPPRQLVSHAHWTLGRRKMSKSDGNVVNPFFAMDRFGVDTMRYYLVHDGGLEHDADYGNEHIVDRYKKGLQNGLGNLLGRVTRSQRWSVREAVRAGTETEAETETETDLFRAQRGLVRQLAATVSGHMDERLDARAALQTVMEAVYQTNRFVQETAPWALSRERDALLAQGGGEASAETRAETGEAAARATARLHQSVFLAAEALRVAGILLQPVMPAKAAEVLDVLGVAADRRTLADARLGADHDYGVPMRSPGKSAYDGLFPPLPVED